MIHQATLALSGEWWDIAHYIDGRPSRCIGHGHNIITDAGLALAAGAIGIIGHGIKTWQMGEGLASWDADPPVPDGTETALVTPTFEKDANIRYWDEAGGTYSVTPSNVLDVRVVLHAGEANGDLREFGIRGAQSGDVLFNYVVHGKIIKTDVFNLERIMRFTLERA